MFTGIASYSPEGGEGNRLLLRANIINQSLASMFCHSMQYHIMIFKQASLELILLNIGYRLQRGELGDNVYIM